MSMPHHYKLFLTISAVATFTCFLSQALSTVQQSMWGGTISQAHAVYSRPWNLIQQQMGPARMAKKTWTNNIFIGSQYLMAILIVKLLIHQKHPTLRPVVPLAMYRWREVYSDNLFDQYDESLFLTSCSFLGRAICDHLVVARLKRPWQKSPIDRTHISPYSRQITRGAGKSPQITPSVHPSPPTNPALTCHWSFQPYNTPQNFVRPRLLVGDPFGWLFFP